MKLRKIYTILILLLLSFTNVVHAVDFTKKYPSYIYVFDEFDVDPTFIDNSEFQSFIVKNERKLKAFYRRSLKRGEAILPTMKGLLVGEGVSDLFLYLSMIESGFSLKAKSVKKAVGLWQFMPATARQYNLKVCNEYDERCDPVSATSAAINYLNKLHKQFGKWYLAAMAYNCGEGCLERAINRAGTDDISILTNNRLKLLPRETRNYIRKILLIAMIGESKNSRVEPIYTNTSKHQELTEVEVAAGTSLRVLARLLNMKYKVLQKLNRRMKNGIVPRYRPMYKIKIPLDKIYAFYLRYDMESGSKVKNTHLVSYTVVLGDTLESIAARYNVNVISIMKANDLVDDFLEVGQLLVIPVSENVFDKSLPAEK